MTDSFTMSVAPSELGKFDPVDDLLILAAVERCRRHQGRVLRYEIAEHLGFNHNAWTTRHLRPRLEELRADGSLQLERQAWREDWKLTRRGRGRLAAARRNRNLPSLPESPQHRSWRHAREEAAERIDEIRHALRVALKEANRTQAEPESSDSALLDRTGKRLGWEFQRLALAKYCLHEWVEPEDGHSDRGERDRRCLSKGFDHGGRLP